MLIKPYIGVTGIVTPEDYANTAILIDSYSTHQLMAGILVSSKTKNGLTNKYPNLYPQVGSIKDLIPTGINSLNLIHYNTDNPELLADEMLEVMNYCGDDIDGFQLNVCWPEIAQLEKFYQHSKRKSVIILEINSQALTQIYNAPKRLVEKIQKSGYLDYIHGILIDPSGGRGQLFNGEIMKNYLTKLYKANLRINIGIAGGLHGGILDIPGYNNYSKFLDVYLKPLAQMYPDLSIDAQGRLRDQNDNLDHEQAKMYIQGAQKIFNSLVKST